MADKTIGSLPNAASLTDASSFVCEDSGEAKRVTGKQFKDFAKQGVSDEAAAQIQAIKSAGNAQTQRVIDEGKIQTANAKAQANAAAQAATGATKSAQEAASSASAASTKANEAAESARSAEDNASKAAKSASSAANSAYSASSSEINAMDAESNAITHADNAKKHAAAAAQSATDAQSAMTAAQTAQSGAEAAHSAAELAASSASTSARQASASEQNAAGSATAAAQSAASIGNAEQVVTQKAEEASTSAANAAASAEAAKKSAEKAASIAGDKYATKTEAQGYANNAESNAKSYTDQQISAIPTPDVSGQIGEHNTNTESHNDIRELIIGLTNRLNTLADSDDTTLDQFSEVVAYIKNNKSLIDGITTSKVNVADIINNLTTNVSNKPLSAAQGVVLKALIDAITVPTKVSELDNDSGYLTNYTETDPTVPAWAKAKSKPTYTASEVGAVPTSRTVNGKALSSNITLNASDVNARPNTWTPSASDVGALPISGGILTGNVTAKYLTGTWLQATESNHSSTTAEKVAVFDTSGWLYHRTAAELRSDIGAVPTSRTVNGKALNANITLAASDVGAYSKSETDSLLSNKAAKTHASQHASGGSDPITPAAIGAAASVHNHANENINPLAIEFYGASSYGGYIDFHYGQSTADYTSRIIESSNGVVTLNNNKILTSANITAIYGVEVKFSSGKAIYSNSAIKPTSICLVQRRSGTAGSATTSMFATTSGNGSLTIVTDNTSATVMNLNIIIINP